MQIRFLGAAPQVGFCLILLLAAARPDAARAARAKIDTRVGAPYLGAMVTDADTGMILFADHPDTPGYPASVLKVMDLLIILEKIKAGGVKLTDPVSVTAESARIGGSQVYLKENEAFTVDELLYALMVQSANDAATALAIHQKILGKFGCRGKVDAKIIDARLAQQPVAAQVRRHDSPTADNADFDHVASPQDARDAQSGLLQNAELDQYGGKKKVYSPSSFRHGWVRQGTSPASPGRPSSRWLLC